MLDAIDKINKHAQSPKKVVLISTVLPGTTRRNFVPRLDPQHQFLYNPYLIAMGSVKWDMVNPEMVMIGTETGDPSEMRELMQEHRPAQFERMGRMMNLRDDLMAEMHGDRPDPDEVQALHGQMAELHGEMMAEMVRMRNAMHDLMSDEQRQQLEQATPEGGVDPDDHDAHH